jgi:hypothetical protein
MTLVVWRQYRTQAAIAALLLAGFAAVLVVTGLRMAAQWHAVLLACSAAGDCATTTPLNVYLGSPVMQVLVLLTIGIPALFGMLWGAPLVAHEIESGTGTFAWTQSVTRLRWLAVKAGWALLAAAAWGGTVAALVSWWSGPKNALYQNAFDPGNFDLQGIAPVGYAVFATALGILAGTLLRRTLPALAVTLGGFIAVRLAVNSFVRQHYMAAVTVYHDPLAPPNLPGSAWILTRGLISKSGQVFSGGSGPNVNGVAISALPASCQQLMYRGPASVVKAGLRAAAACVRSQGFRGFTTYQPANRFWAFQGIETGIFVVVAAALLAGAFAVVIRRDA